MKNKKNYIYILKNNLLVYIKIQFFSNSRNSMPNLKLSLFDKIIENEIIGSKDFSENTFNRIDFIRCVFNNTLFACTNCNNLSLVTLTTKYTLQCLIFIN